MEAWGRPIGVGTPVKNPDAGGHKLPAVPSFFFPCVDPCATGGKSRDHRRQKILQSRLPIPGPSCSLLHHDNSAQAAQLNAAVYNSPSVLTFQAHDESL